MKQAKKSNAITQATVGAKRAPEQIWMLQYVERDTGRFEATAQVSGTKSADTGPKK